MKFTIRLALMLMIAFGAVTPMVAARADDATPIATPIDSGSELCVPSYSVDRELEVNITELPGPFIQTEIEPLTESLHTMRMNTIVFGANAHTSTDCYPYTILLEVKEGLVRVRTQRSSTGTVTIWSVSGVASVTNAPPYNGEYVLRAGDRAYIFNAPHQLYTLDNEGAVVEVTVIFPSLEVSPCNKCLTYP